MRELLRRSTFLKPLQALALLYGLWQLTAWCVPAWPSAHDVFRVLGADLRDPGFQHALLGSARRMAIGYTLVMAIGIGGGMLLGRLPLIDQVLGSVAVALHAIPGAAWVPLSIIWFGMTEQAVIFTILLGAAGIVMVSTDTGIREVPPLITRAARTMGAFGLRYFWFVVVPAAIPKIVDGLRLAWAFGWRALMAGELLTSVSGLGQLLNQVAKAQQLDQLLAIMLLIAAVGIGVDALIFKRLEHAVRVRWGLAS
ncbi:MAG: ABC transporter permease [Candidatus Omnitrophica bacterium CG11_big_fil_rev_8_21_14_0_20_63_9]|nr:MAG: ABC transporter permease [Candidatus Omnitrophica bacterium CG11_big_fil_rev_8_21_14_0_20_63_9]